MSTGPAPRVPVMARPGGLPPRLLDRRSGALMVVLVLTIGASVLPGIGWLIGVILLWSSFSWTRGDKVVGTLTGPISLALPVAARLLLPGDVIAAPSAGCGEGGYCAPRLSAAWYADVSNIGAFLVVVHLALALYLVARFRPGRFAAERTPGTVDQRGSTR